MPFKKNTAVTGFTFGLVSSTDGSAVTGGTTTGYYTLDGGTQGTIAGTPAHEGNGQWSVNLTAAEMNGDVVGLAFINSSAIGVYFTIKTETKLVSELNDIAATSIVTGGAITTSGGAVSNVTTVATTTTNTDMRGTDNALLAASAPANFGDLTISATTGLVTVGTNNDKTGYSISGTKTTLDALNDIAATAVVTGGAITTSGGAVSTVTTVGTCTTNTDMRGTDNALLAASAPTNFGDLAITVTTGQVTVGTNNDKTGYSISGTKTTLDALNDIAATAIVTGGAITTSSGAVSNVTLVATTTTNTDMRGTDNAALASVCTEARLAELDAANLPTDIAGVQTDTTAILVDTGSPAKNATFSNIAVFMVDSTDHVTPKTGLTLTVTRSIDGGAFGSATGTPAEIGNGVYQFDASAADMNGDSITFRFASAGADDTFITVYTRA